MENKSWGEISDKDKSVWKPIDKERTYPTKKEEPRDYNQDLNILRERMKKSESLLRQRTKYNGGK